MTTLAEEYNESERHEADLACEFRQQKQTSCYSCVGVPLTDGSSIADKRCVEDEFVIANVFTEDDCNKLIQLISEMKDYMHPDASHALQFQPSKLTSTETQASPSTPMPSLDAGELEATDPNGAASGSSLPPEENSRNPRRHAPKNRRKRKSRPKKKVLPTVYQYVEPTERDVLLGRGGRSNYWPGNKRYREEVKNLQAWYKSIQDFDEKTDLSQCLVEYVHSYGGRFLEKDNTNGEPRWYIVPNLVARRKASQALREDNDPAKRAAKRARHLAKKQKELTTHTTS